MDETYLYQQIADAIRTEILEGRLKPGQRLPSIRKLCSQWNCTPGTIQRAYHGLAREGLLVSQAGRGSQVAGSISQSKAQIQGTLRRASLVHRSEAFLLEAITAGYGLDEIQQSLDLAMDRWRVLNLDQEKAPVDVLRFTGSHDMVLNEIAHRIFGQVIPGTGLNLIFNGSLGGLMALAEGKCDLAGCHLWDADSDSYNLPYIEKLFPGKELMIVRLANRRMGLMVAPGNPLNIRGVTDLARPAVRFVNRQPGSGTRVWLDTTLQKQGIPSKRIQGYQDERLTHSEVARVVAEGQADTGLGLQSAALAYGLDFVFLNLESYDLVLFTETARRPSVEQLIRWLGSEDGRAFVTHFPGYEGQTTGQTWLMQT